MQTEALQIVYQIVTWRDSREQFVHFRRALGSWLVIRFRHPCWRGRSRPDTSKNLRKTCFVSDEKLPRFAAIAAARLLSALPSCSTNYPQSTYSMFAPRQAPVAQQS